jgi:hypothetical protein
MQGERAAWRARSRKIKIESKKYAWSPDGATAARTTFARRAAGGQYRREPLRRLIFRGIGQSLRAGPAGAGDSMEDDAYDQG